MYSTRNVITIIDQILNYFFNKLFVNIILFLQYLWTNVYLILYELHIAKKKNYLH